MATRSPAWAATSSRCCCRKWAGWKTRGRGRGLVRPVESTPVGEETGLIVPLGAWVLRTACAQNRAWQDAGLPPMRVGGELSPPPFPRGGVVGTVAGVLAETGL